MIRQPDDAQTAWFLRACLRDPFGAVLTTRFAVYPPGSGKAGFWAALDDEGEPVGALSLMDGALTAVFPDENRADPEELLSFAAYLRAKTLLVSGYPLGEPLTALCCARDFPDTASPPEASDLPFLPALMTGGSASEPERAAMLTDLTLRFGAGLLRGRVIRSEGKPVSCAVTAGETAACALISGVATDPAYRGKGFARACVTSLVGASGKRAFVLTDSADLAGWYAEMGFVPWERHVYTFSI